MNHYNFQNLITPYMELLGAYREVDDDVQHFHEKSGQEITSPNICAPGAAFDLEGESKE